MILWYQINVRKTRHACSCGCTNGLGRWGRERESVREIGKDRKRCGERDRDRKCKRERVRERERERVKERKKM